MIRQKGYTPTQQFNSDQCSSDITFKTFSIALSYLYFCSGEITCSMGSIIPVLRCPTKRRTYWSVMVGWITYSLQFRHMKFTDTWLTLSDRNWANKIHLHLATYTATDRQTDRHVYTAAQLTSSQYDQLPHWTRAGLAADKVRVYLGKHYIRLVQLLTVISQYSMLAVVHAPSTFYRDATLVTKPCGLLELVCMTLNKVWLKHWKEQPIRYSVY